MNRVIVTKWDDAADGPLTVDAVRNLHMPARQFRVSPERYPSREVVHGITARAGRFYILRGRCRITYPDESVELAPGDVADLAEGTHSLEVLGDADLEAVAVWELPFAVRE